jgi:hypothetical protein
MTNELKEHLIRCEKAVQSTKPILAKRGFPDDYRTVTVIGFISVLIEHQESVLLLVMHNNVGSASALVRPIVEGAFRGLWINLPATDEEVKKFNEKNKIDLEFGDLATALDTAYGMGDFFQDFKTRTWKHLNSYTHGGMHQIGRRFVKHEVASNYSEDEIYEMTTTVTTMVLILTSFFLKKQGHVDSADEIQALLETYGPVADKKKAVDQVSHESKGAGPHVIPTEAAPPVAVFDSPSRFRLFLKRHRQSLSLVGALIVFSTFVIKDAIREEVKDTVDSLQAAEDVFVTRSENEETALTLASIDAYVEELSNKTDSALDYLDNELSGVQKTVLQGKRNPTI